MAIQQPAPVPSVPPAPPAPAPAPAPVAPRRRRPARRFSAALFWVVVGALAALFAANLAGYGPAVVKHEKVRVVLPPSQQTTALPTPQVGTPTSPPASVGAAPTPPKAKAEVDIDVNVNVHVRAPQQLQPFPLCPKVGYYVLSHEPTTDWRQYDDRRNWIPGHMELVRECRNGALNEFSRWVGHSPPVMAERKEERRENEKAPHVSGFSDSGNRDRM